MKNLFVAYMPESDLRSLMISNKSEMRSRDWRDILTNQRISFEFFCEFKKEFIQKCSETDLKFKVSSFSEPQLMQILPIAVDMCDFKFTQFSMQFLTKFLKTTNEINSFIEEISQYQNLTEEFIYENHEMLDMDSICQFQQMSIVFINQLIQENIILDFHVESLLDNQKINQDELKLFFAI